MFINISVKILCCVLFDITKTNVSARRHGLETLSNNKQRSQQSNFETILQIISMRGQPENVTDPEKTMNSLKDSKWGSDYSSKNKIPVWKFQFDVEQPGVFNDGSNELGNLFKDSHGIPIITGLEEWPKLSNTIDVSPELRNIYFEVINDE